MACDERQALIRERIKIWELLETLDDEDHELRAKLKAYCEELDRQEIEMCVNKVRNTEEVFAAMKLTRK